MASGIKVELEGSRELQKQLERIAKTAPKKLDGVFFSGATKTQEVAVKSIQGHQSSGVTYKRRSVEHTASTAGNPPNSDTGRLVKNITVQKIDGGYDVGSRKDAPHGLWLEFGTSSTAPRPWLRPAYDLTVAWVLDKLKKIEVQK